MRAVNPRTIMVGCVRIIRAVTAATQRESEGTVKRPVGRKAGFAVREGDTKIDVDNEAVTVKLSCGEKIWSSRTPDCKR